MRRPSRQPTWICSTTGQCLCSGSDGQCDCKRKMTYVTPEVGPSRDPVRVDLCAKCGAGMICIDFSTGELLAAPEEVAVGLR